MHFYAVTKEGLIIYDANDIVKNTGAQWEDGGWRDWAKGEGADGLDVKVVATLTSPPNAFGHTWSDNGALIASVFDEGVKIYDAEDEYKETHELPRVQENIEGRVGGVRNLQFSPKNNFMVTYEKWEPGLDNVHVWDLRCHPASRLHDCLLKGYASGPLNVELVKWTSDESACLELVPGKGVRVWPADFGENGDSKEAFIGNSQVAHFKISPAQAKDAYCCAVFVPEIDSRVARVIVYSLGNLSKPLVEVDLPPKVKDAQMYWNHEGSALLVLASSDVDETNQSYFGTTFLYFVKTDGKAKPIQLYNAKDGLVQDLCWNPTKNEFMCIVGMLPATVRLHDGSTGKEKSTLGSSKRNTLSWNPFGRLIAVGGFGTLPGDMDFFDCASGETVCSLRAALTVDCSWAPDGRHFLAATVAPRMNEGNQLSIYRYTGEKVLNLNYVPEVVEGRHQDTGAGARTKTQALLFRACWRPGQEVHYEDKPTTPRPGVKRTKGLPDDVKESKASSGKAWTSKSGGGGASLVAAIMRGEVDAPQETTRWENNSLELPKQLEEWEIRKMERDRKKAEEKKKIEDKEKEKQLIRDAQQATKDNKKLLKELQKELEELQAIKDKEWDELTDEDEAQLEKESDLIAQIADLEKKVKE